MSFVTFAKNGRSHVVTLVQPCRATRAAGHQNDRRPRRRPSGSGPGPSVELRLRGQRPDRCSSPGLPTFTCSAVSQRWRSLRPCANSGPACATARYSSAQFGITLATRRDAVGKARVVRDDVGTLATELLRHPLDRRSGIPGHLDTGARGTGERHHVDVGMARQRAADAGTVAVDEVVHPGRDAAASRISVKI